MSLAERRAEVARTHDNLVRQVEALNQERLRKEGQVQLLDELIAEEEKPKPRRRAKP